MENTIYLSLIDIIVHLFLLGIYVTSWTKLNLDSVSRVTCFLEIGDEAGDYHCVIKRSFYAI